MTHLAGAQGKDVRPMMTYALSALRARLIAVIDEFLCEGQDPIVYRCSCGYYTTDKALFEFHVTHEHLGPVKG